MMKSLKYIITALTGPQLYEILSTGDGDKSYHANILERIPNRLLTFLKFGVGIFKWTFPFWISYCYRKGYFTTDHWIYGCCYYVPGALLLVSVLIIMRGFGRLLNPRFREFSVVLDKAQLQPSLEALEELRKYDFDFSHWPSSFHFDPSSKSVGSQYHNVSPYADENNDIGDVEENGFLKNMLSPVVTGLANVASYLLAHSIGVRMAFPGCVSVINFLMSTPLRAQRAKLIKDYKIKRVKLTTEDGFDVESFYRDNRSVGGNGQYMVICSEGNASYPEVGTPCIPLAQSYSVIGWHHAGFQGSTGLPFADREQKSIHTVMEFVLQELNWPVDKIIVFAWSIGGYPASWLAMQYPGIKYVVLDATFDNLEALATRVFPASLSDFVLLTVKRYMNLDVAAQLVKYPGPILLIRRSQDEIISTTIPPTLESNCGNDLLFKLIKYRYPVLCTPNLQSLVRTFIGLDKREKENIMKSTQTSEVDVIISRLGKMESITYPLIEFGNDLPDETKLACVYNLVIKYMKDFDAKHNEPLNPDFFKEPPWCSD